MSRPVQAALAALVAALAAALGFTVGATQASTGVVANPAPGIASVRISDEEVPERITIRVTATAPITSGHFSALLFDTDGDGAGDRAVVAAKSDTSGSISVRTAPASGTECQQFAGTTTTAVPQATGAFGPDPSVYTASVPASKLPGSFWWLALGVAPADHELCGGTDGAVVGVARSFAGAHRFAAGPLTPPIDTTPPVAPTGLTATGADGKSVLGWSDNAEPDLGGYLVYRRVAGGAFTMVGEPATSAFTDTAVSNGVTYEYYVRARDTSGNLSDESSRVTVTPSAPVPGPGPNDPGTPPGGNPPGTPPVGAPQDPGPPAPLSNSLLRRIGKPRVNANSRRVILDWPGRRGIVRYRVYRRNAGASTAAARWPKRPLRTVRASRFVDRRIKRGRRYQYRIVGVTRGGRLTKPSKTVTVRIKRAPRRK